MSTPERQQDPGEHGYGGVQQEKQHRGQEHPLDDPEAEPQQPARSDEDVRDEPPRAISGSPSSGSRNDSLAPHSTARE
jgi:hypothetical protein